MPVGSKVRGRMPRKKTVQSSITSMGFPLLQKAGEICGDRQIGVSGKFRNLTEGTAETLYMTYLREANDVLKLTTPRQSSRKKQKFSGGFRGVSVLESEVTETTEFHVVSDEIRRWSSLSEGECQRFVSAEDGILNEFEMMWQLRILFPLHFVVFKQTACHLTSESNVEQVFSRAGQLSEVNLDPDALADMVSMMFR